jgi:hypothetical protein
VFPTLPLTVATSVSTIQTPILTICDDDNNIYHSVGIVLEATEGQENTKEEG